MWKSGILQPLGSICFAYFENIFMFEELYTASTMQKEKMLYTKRLNVRKHECWWSIWVAACTRFANKNDCA